MSSTEEPVIHKPKEEETLQQYLQRYSIEETQRIFADPEKRKRFCAILIQTPWREVHATVQCDAQDKLNIILKKTENYKILLHYIDLWRDTRAKLLELLSECVSELNELYKMCAVGRMIGCSVDTFSTIAALYFSESKYGNLASGVATGFGCFVIASTGIEMKFSSDIFCNLMAIIQKDQDLFANIVKWFMQNEELEKAIRNVFHIDITPHMVKALENVLEETSFSAVNLLSTLVAAMFQHDKVKDKEKIQDFFKNFLSFFSCKSTSEFFELISSISSSKSHPANLDVLKMMLKYYKNPLQYLMCQSAKALAPVNPNLNSFRVWGRIVLNALSVMNDINRLWKFQAPGICEMELLIKNLKYEQKIMDKIVKFFSSDEIN